MKIEVMRKSVALFVFAMLLIMGLVLTSGCADRQDVSASSDKPIVAVSILPQAEFVEKIAGDQVEVLVMVPQGADPHTYEITSGQLRDLSKAQMYVKVGSGLDFENIWMDRLIAQNSDMLIVDSSKGIALRTMESDPHADEGQEEGGSEVHDVEEAEENQESNGEGIKDPHIWTSPINAKIMVNNTYEGLVQIHPENKNMYMQNRDAYLAELDAADAMIKETLSGKEGSSFIVYHPSWGYFAGEYGLEQVSVEIEGKEPSAKDMQDLIDTARERNISVIFVQAGFSTASANAIASGINGQVVAVDPLAKDYIDNLAKVTAAFEKGLA